MFSYRYLRSTILALMLFSAAPKYAPAAPPRVVHVFVSLADNQHQGIVPVPARLGNGDDPGANLYWGAAFGVKTFFRSSAEWTLISDGPGPSLSILERAVFRHRSGQVFLVADAYQGSKIRQAVNDFLSAAAGLNDASVHMSDAGQEITLTTGGGSDLVVYVGHDAFMDFSLPSVSGKEGVRHPAAIVLACASKSYFGPYLRNARSTPLLWTTGLMAPEAYTLKAALDGWIAEEDSEHIRQRAAIAYDKYQHCGLRGAQRLFVSGW